MCSAGEATLSMLHRGVVDNIRGGAGLLMGGYGQPMRVSAGTSNGYWHSHTEPSHDVELEGEVMKGSRQPGAFNC